MFTIIGSSSGCSVETNLNTVTKLNEQNVKQLRIVKGADSLLVVNLGGEDFADGARNAVEISLIEPLARLVRGAVKGDVWHFVVCVSCTWVGMR